MDCVYTPGPINSYELMVQHRYVVPFYVMNETLVHNRRPSGDRLYSLRS
jgi:hypothetical protein